MGTQEIYKLDIWKGDWGLPSVDTNCLQVLTYAKLCGIKVNVNKTSNPFRTPNGQLPVLRTSETTLDSVQKIIELFEEKSRSIENNFQPQQYSEVIPYEYMLKEKLYPALQFVWWIDQRNFNEVIRPWYAKAVPFPFNFWYPARYEKAAQSLMEVLFPKEESISVIETKVYSDALKCLNLLSTRLGESDFFLGSYPSALDALVYAYLAPLLKAPLRNPALQNHLKAYTNLFRFVSRVSQRCFEEEHQSYERIKAAENEKKLENEETSILPHKRRNQLIAGIVAFAAMTGYAVSHGIIKVQLGDDDASDDSEDYILVEPDMED